MKQRVALGLTLLTAIICAVPALATPSSTYWTPCVMDIQPAGVTHLGIDNYFRVGNNEAFPVDIGPEWGASVTKKLSAEFGFDVLANQNDPLFFNAKIGYREGVLSRNAPGIQIGMFDIGAKHHVTDFDIAYLVLGKSLPDGKTRVHIAGYYGNPGALKSGTGDRRNTGWMAAMDRQLGKGGKWVLAADYASGKNFIGGGGVGVYYYFTKDISLLVGPVWFNDRTVNGEMKWTTQLDINF